MECETLNTFKVSPQN